MGEHMQANRRAGGMIAVNQQLSAIAERPATLKQLLACFKSNAALRRAFRYALQAELSPKAKSRPRGRLLAPQAQLQQLQPVPPPEQPQPPPAPAELPEQPAQRPEPPAETGQKWSETKKYGSGTWG